MSIPNAEPSLGELISELGQKTGLLVRQEVQLAKTEMTAQAALAARKVGFIGAGGALAHAGLLAVIAGLIAALGTMIPLWISALLIGLVVFGVGYGLVQVGIQSLRRIDPVPRTRETMRENKALIQEQLR